MKIKTLLLGTAFCLGLGMNGFGQTTFDGLVGHWKFDEGTGTAVGDELGTTNGELLNASAAAWVDGFLGKAIDYSQTAGDAPAYTRFDGNGVANIAESFTISMWVKTEMSPDGDTEYSIISKGVPFYETNGRDGGWYHLSLKDNKIRLMVWDESALSSPDGALPEGMEWDPNTWYHIVGVRDISDYTLYTYLNGEEISTAEDGLFGDMTNDEDLTFGSVAHGNQTEVGDALWGSNFKGALDEVQLYNVALSAEQVKTMYDTYMGGASSIDEKFVNTLQIAPNPVSNTLMVENASDIAKVEIYNLTGALVKTINNQNSVQITTNVEELTTGMYVIKAFNRNNTVSTGKFAKK